MLLSQYGMDRGVDTTPGTVFQKLVGTTQLYTSSSGPEGVLYRPISKIEDAIELGGLILMNAAGTRWQFWVGNDLIDAMAWNQIGKRPIVHPQFATKVVLRKNEKFELFGNTANTLLTQYLARVEPRMNPTPTFAAGEVVHAFGILTSARFGLGINGTGIGTCASYMCSTEQMNVPFSKYLADVKAAALAAVPSSIRSFYEDTYTATVAGLPFRAVHASIGIATHWKGRTLADLQDRSFHKHVIADNSGKYGYTGLAAFYGYGIPLAEAKARLILDNPDFTLTETATSYGVALGVISGPPSVVLPEHSATDSPPRPIEFYDGPGCIPVADEYSTWKGFAMCSDMRSDPTPRSWPVVPPHNGTVGNLSCGVIRDAHTLERAINQGVNNSAVASTYSDLAALVRAQIGTRSRDYWAPSALANLSAANAALADTAASRGLRYTSVLNRGSLADYIEQFSDAWDTKAEEAAKAS